MSGQTKLPRNVPSKWNLPPPFPLTHCSSNSTVLLKTFVSKLWDDTMYILKTLPQDSSARAILSLPHLTLSDSLSFCLRSSATELLVWYCATKPLCYNVWNSFLKNSTQKIPNIYQFVPLFVDTCWLWPSINVFAAPVWQWKHLKHTTLCTLRRLLWASKPAACAPSTNYQIFVPKSAIPVGWLGVRKKRKMYIKPASSIFETPRLNIRLRVFPV